MGGIQSSASDLVKYLRYQIDNNSAFLPSSFKESILVSEKDSLGTKDGWLVFFRGDEELIWHNGMSGGCNSFMRYNIATKSGIVILSNSQSSITDIGLHYLSENLPLNRSKVPLVIKIEEKIKRNQFDSIEIVWNAFDSLKFEKNPIHLYWLQCHYISENRLEIALRLNELLLTDFQNDWEVFFYRAKIFELMKDYSSAIAMYTEVNQLFPENHFIQKRIERCLRASKTKRH